MGSQIVRSPSNRHNTTPSHIVRTPSNRFITTPSQIPSQFLTHSTHTRGTSQRNNAENSSVSKAKWTESSTETFIKLCVIETNNGNRPTTHFNRAGWKNIVTSFHQQTGLNYCKDQLKNKWDALKKEWGIWTKLTKNETGLGWNAALGTVDATDEWWRRKLLETPEAAKFKLKGPTCVYDQEVLFGDVVATGNNSWTPSSGVLPENIHDAQSEHVNENEDEQEEDLAADPTHTNTEFAHVEPESQGGSSIGKRRGRFPPHIRGMKTTKKMTTAQQVVKCLQTMVTKLDKLNSHGCGCKHCKGEDTLDACMTTLDNMEGVVEGDKLWLYATRLFLKPNIRDLFLKFKTDDVRRIWLEDSMERDKFKKGGFNDGSSYGSSRGPFSGNNSI